MLRRSALPGFGLTMGYTLVYLSLIVLIPLATLAVKTAELSPGELWALATSPRAMASYRVTFGSSFIEALEPEVEEVAAVLGASRRQTVLRVVVPAVTPALLTGFALAFARAIGEYGSVVFISGNKQLETEITPLLIMTRLEQFDYAGAT